MFTEGFETDAPDVIMRAREKGLCLEEAKSVVLKTSVNSQVIKRANTKIIQACKAGIALPGGATKEKTVQEIRDAFRMASSRVRSK
jgi:hypothetical protein